MNRFILAIIVVALSSIVKAQKIGINAPNPTSDVEAVGSVALYSKTLLPTNPPVGSKIKNFNNGTTISYGSGFDSVGTIYDFGGPLGNYSNNLLGQCEILGTGGSSCLYISFSIDTLSLASGDTLFFLDGYNSSSPLVKYYTNTFQTNVTLNLKGCSAYIIFKTDSADNASGFKIDFKRVFESPFNSSSFKNGPGLVFNASRYSLHSGFNDFNSTIGKYSNNLGFKNNVSGDYSTALGQYNTASGGSSFTSGAFSLASGLVSTSIGNSCSATGYNSVAIGYYTAATGHYAFATGHYASATGNYSTTFGSNTYAIGDYSTALGNNNKAKSFASLSLGRNCDTIAGSNPYTWVSTDPVLIIGNGTSNTATSNCFVIYKNGNGWMQGTLTQASDKRLKKNISPLNNALNKINMISGYNYNWKDENVNKDLQAGLLAQEIQEQMPELVSTQHNGELAVNYSGMIPYLIEAVKELKAENEELKKEMKRLKKRK